MNFLKPGVAMLAASILTQPVFAALPDPVRTMIESAFEEGDEAEIDAVIAVAKRTNPDDAAEIDAMRAAYDTAQTEAREDRLASQGFFEGWSGEGEVGFSRSSGNSDTTNLSAGVALTREGLRWRHELRARADFQRNNGVTTREQFVVAFEPRYKFNERLYTFGLAQYERDPFQGYNARYTLSGGLGYRVIDGDAVTLDLQAGPAYRQTNFVGGASDSSIAALASGDLRWQISDGLAFRQQASAILESGTSTFTSETSLEARISGALSAKLGYLVEYESDPPPGNESTDTLTRATLVYGF